MGLVDYHEVEMAHAESALAVPRLVDEAHHRRIRRDEDAAFRVLLGDQVHGRRIGQMALEGVHRLVDQRDAIRQEQHPLRPVAAHEEIGQRDDRARLPRAGRHGDEERVAQPDLAQH